MIGHLLPGTCGCVDIAEGGAHAHRCDAEPGGIVRTIPGDPGHPAAWRIGSTITLDRYTGPGAPGCTVMATRPGEMRRTKLDPDGDVNTYRQAPDGMATFQWKGTVTCLDFTCGCGSACEVRDRGFVYAVACPECDTIYVCRDWVTAERVEVIRG